ncbi:MAG: YraN family protein [SAR324 cluster bacterium]|nr:YraN family protein [SAR324 cluster bacterium]
MIDLRKKTGDKGEKLALKHLKAKGYKLLEKNWRKVGGELDLIMVDGEFIIFVEVKTRNNDKSQVSPKLQMTKNKILQVRKIAQYYLLEKRNEDLQPRFDFVGITLKADEKPEIEHIENAF